MRPRYLVFTAFIFALVMACVYPAFSWTPLDVENDPLVRMPGTQPNQGVDLWEPVLCLPCHGMTETDEQGNIVTPGFSWTGSMMAQAMRDPLFWAAITVTAQDSIWAVGNPNAVDICLRCHTPEGWLAGRCDPTNASELQGSDFDGVHCDACHRMWDPFFETTFNGTREGYDWSGYWDEFDNIGPGSGTLSQNAAELTRDEDAILAGGIKLFSGESFYDGNVPGPLTFTENASGQFFVSIVNDFGEYVGHKRASFADTVSDHAVHYSRYHKSKYFCGTCHDISNPVLANLGYVGPILPSEQQPAYEYFHVERAFSEFWLSAYGQQGGASGMGPFDPAVYQTSDPNNKIRMCQDCHMRDVQGKGSWIVEVPLRPDESTEHPNSGSPLHNQQGGNLWMTYILATLDDDLPNIYDEVNYQLFTRPYLTVDMNAGISSPIDNGPALLAASERAKEQLKRAATIQELSYDRATGNLSFRIQNNTGHKLITAFPEGRRMFVNIKAYRGASLIYEVNPYDYAAGTLKGVKFPDSAPLLSDTEVYVDELVYEVHLNSILTGETEKTFHVALATGRYKDNRIPPKGFDKETATTRLCEPVWHGASDKNYFTTQEYAGGYDEVDLTGILPSGADRVEVALYYQGTSREYIKFLKDEINGTASTLSEPTPSEEEYAYIIQTDPFFAGLKAWGDTIWDLWYHNHGLDGQGASVDGIVPFRMTQAIWGVCECELTPDATAVPRAGTLGFQATVKNNTDKTGSVLFGSKVTKPDQTTTGWLIGPFTVFLNPYQSKSKHKSHTVPVSFDPGTYTYHGYVGRSGGIIYHACQFEFEVTAGP